MAEVLETMNYIHGFVRCGDTFLIGENHVEIVLNEWSELHGEVDELTTGLLEKFGEEHIDMGLIVRRNNNKLEVGGFSSSFCLPSWELVKKIRPITILRIKVLYPNDEVVENVDLRRTY